MTACIQMHSSMLNDFLDACTTFLFCFVAVCCLLWVAQWFSRFLVIPDIALHFWIMLQMTHFSLHLLSFRFSMVCSVYLFNTSLLLFCFFIIMATCCNCIYSCTQVSCLWLATLKASLNILFLGLLIIPWFKARAACSECSTLGDGIFCNFRGLFLAGASLADSPCLFYCISKRTF